MFLKKRFIGLLVLIVLFISSSIILLNVFQIYNQHVVKSYNQCNYKRKLYLKKYTIQIGIFKSIQHINCIINQVYFRKLHVYTIPSVPIKGHYNYVVIDVCSPTDKRIKYLLKKLKKYYGLNGSILNR